MRAVLFDFDGVLVDSEPLHFRVMRACLLETGISVARDEYARHYVGRDDWTALRLALEIHGRPPRPGEVNALAERKAEIFEDLLPEIPFFPGARELVLGLASELPVAIVSGARRGEIERTLEAASLRGAFAAIVGVDDVSQVKPHPEPYLAGMRGVADRAPGLTPRQCLVVEDSMPGIAAGRAAGMKVLAVAHTHAPERLTAAHAVVPRLDGVTPADLHALFR